MRIILTTIIAIVLFTSCGVKEQPTTSAESIDTVAVEETVVEIPPAVVEQVLSAPEPVEAEPFYSASDLKLPAGEVLQFAPSDETIDEASANGVCSIPIYIHIQDKDGKIHIEKTTYEVWLNIQTGTVLR